MGSAAGGGPRGWGAWGGRTARAADSPQWPESLDDERLTVLWRQPLGPSYSGPIVVGDRVFTTETRKARDEVVYAYDRRTGELLWEQQWEGWLVVPFFAAANGSWIRATPACDGERLYVAGIRDVLVCLDVQTGEPLWRADLASMYDAPPPAFGFVSSPLLAGDHVFVQAAESLVKLDKRTGEPVWRAAVETGAMNSAFSSPVVARLGGRDLLVVQTRSALKGIDPETGAEQWSQPIEAYQGMNILTPTVYDDALLTSAHSGKTQLWRLPDAAGETAAEDGAVAEPGLTQAWSHPAQAYMSSPVVIGDFAYMHLRNQRAMCLDLRTGEEKWRSRPYGKYWSMAFQGDKILALDEAGQLLLLRATPEKFELLDSRDVTEGSAWAHVAVCGGQVFVRALDELIVFQWQ